MINKQNLALQEANEKLIKKAQSDMQKALDRQALVHADEIARLAKNTKVEIITKEIIKYVDQVEIRNECLNVGDDVMRLLNESVRGGSDPN